MKDNKYQIFTNNLYEILISHADEFKIHILDNNSYYLEYMDEKHVDNKYNEKICKVITDKVYFSLLNNTELPSISVDSNEYLIYDNNAYEPKEGILDALSVLSSHDIEKIYKNIFSSINMHDLLEKSVDIVKKTNRKKIVLFCFNKIKNDYEINKKDAYHDIYEIIYDEKELNLIPEYRKEILKLLELIYPQILEEDKIIEKNNNSNNKSLRDCLGKILKRAELSENWHLYDKFLPNAIYKNSIQLPIFTQPNHQYIVLEINHEPIRAKYSNLMNENQVNTMLEFIVGKINKNKYLFKNEVLKVICNKSDEKNQSEVLIKLENINNTNEIETQKNLLKLIMEKLIELYCSLQEKVSLDNTYKVSMSALGGANQLRAEKNNDIDNIFRKEIEFIILDNTLLNKEPQLTNKMKI